MVSFSFISILFKGDNSLYSNKKKSVKENKHLLSPVAAGDEYVSDRFLAIVTLAFH